MTRTSAIALLTLAACGTVPTHDTTPTLPETQRAAAVTAAQQAPSAPLAVAAPFTQLVHCATPVHTTWQLVYDLATNDAGDQLVHMTVADSSGVFAERTQVLPASETVFGAGSVTTHQAGASGGGQYVTAGYSVSTQTLTFGGQTFASNTGVCQPASGQPSVGGTPVTLGQITRKVWCLDTVDVAAGNYVDLDYQIVYDATGASLSSASVASRFYGGATSAAAFATGQAQPLGVTADMLDARNGGAWTLGYDSSFTWSLTYTDQDNASYAHPVTWTQTFDRSTQKCFDYAPVKPTH